MNWVNIGSDNDLLSAKLLPETVLAYCQLDSWEQISVKFESKFYHFHSRKCIWNCRLQKMAAILSRGSWVNNSNSIPIPTQIIAYVFFILAITWKTTVNFLAANISSILFMMTNPLQYSKWRSRGININVIFNIIDFKNDLTSSESASESVVNIEGDMHTALQQFYCGLKTLIVKHVIFRVGCHFKTKGTIIRL